MGTDQGLEQEVKTDAAVDADVPVEQEAVETPESVDTPVDVDALQAEVERLRGHNEKLLAEKKAAKSSLSEVEQLQERLQALEEENATAKAEALQSRRVAQLAGKVAAPEKALLLLEDAHIGKDGVIDVEKFLADNPMFAVVKSGPAPVASGGKAPEATDMNAVLRKAAGR